MKKLLFTLSIFMFVISCDEKDDSRIDNSIKSNRPSIPILDQYIIGASYKGGKIAYILNQNDPGYDVNIPHGLIAAPYDQSSSITWDRGLFTPDILIGNTGQVYGIGNANTLCIVQTLGSGDYAAKLCDDLVLNGYNDWYLPSRYELRKLYTNRVLIGGFIYASYWSSSEDDIDSAWSKIFSNSAGESTVSKKVNHRVRAVRSF